MTYIARDDGERFIIPSYRDVLTAKQKSALKNEILTLSRSYGEYITLQRKSTDKYEVAFSTDRGYLLGESIWHYFQRPTDMVYCEAVSGTTEAILVIVKSGSVYLDGSFPIDSIPEELVVFLTEQNNFEIFVYGDVPISESSEDGKFCFDAASVKKFTTLDNPIFPTLPLLKPYQFEIVDTVLKANGIGVFPLKQLAAILAIIAVAWMAWSYLAAPAEIVEAPPPPPPQVNPYQGFFDSLSTPTPTDQVNMFISEYLQLTTIPGWDIKNVTYTNGSLTASIQSQGAKLATLYAWASQNNAVVNIRKDGIVVTVSNPIESRPQPKNIYPLKQALARLIDDISTIYPGNRLSLGDSNNHDVYSDMGITINVENVSIELLRSIGLRLKGFPLTLQNMSFSVNNGTLSGAITLTLLGR